MTQAMIQDTVILNKFHQLTPEQQQQMLDFMDFLLFKKEIKDDTITQIKSKPALYGLSLLNNETAINSLKSAFDAAFQVFLDEYEELRKDISVTSVSYTHLRAHET